MLIVKNRAIARALLLSSVLVMSACGGGGGGGGGDPDPGTGGGSGGPGPGGGGGGGGTSGSAKPGDNRYLPYLASLHLVDTTNPGATPIEITPNDVDYEALFQTYDYNFTTSEVNNFRHTAMVYAQGGHLYKVDLTTTSDLIPVQVSSESDFFNDCDVYEGSLGDNSNQGFIIYEKPGMDGLCYPTTDNTYSMVMINQDSTSDPVDLTGIVSNVYGMEVLSDVSNNSIVHTGYLVEHSATELRHYDADLNTFTTVGSPVANAYLLEGSTLPGKYFMDIDGDIRVYDTSTRTLSDPVFTGNTAWGIHCRANQCAFTVDKPVSGLMDIYTMPADGSSAATLLLADLDIAQNNFLFNEVVLTNTKIFYVENDSVGGVQILKSIPVTGGTPTTVDTAQLINIAATRNANVFYNTDYDIYAANSGSSSVASDSTAIAIQEDGTPFNSFSQSAWVGFNINNISINTGLAAEYVILANGYTDLATGLAGASIESYSGSSGALANTLGVLELDVFAFSFVSFGTNGLATAAAVNPVLDPANPPPTVTSYDVYYADPATANSLARVTDTDNVFEWIFF